MGQNSMMTRLSPDDLAMSPSPWIKKDKLSPSINTETLSNIIQANWVCNSAWNMGGSYHWIQLTSGTTPDTFWYHPYFNTMSREHDSLMLITVLTKGWEEGRVMSMIYDLITEFNHCAMNTNQHVWEVGSQWLEVGQFKVSHR